MPIPRVSIITPSYNQAPYLEATLQSLLRQDYAEMEALVIDGGSTDGSPEIIRKYADRLAYWVSEPDQGQADAINKGFARTQGEIVAWLNSDDLYLPGAVQAAVQALQADPELVLVYGDALSIDAYGKPFNLQRFPQYTLADLLGFRIICQPAVFFRRSALEQAGHLDLSYHFLLDHHFWLRLAALGPIRHVPQILAAARHHPAAKNVAQAARFGAEARRIAEWLPTCPALADQAQQYAHQIRAGAYRLSARYLLDGDQPAAALRDYFQAFLASPAFTLEEANRILFAALSLPLGSRRLRRLYDRRRAQRTLELPAGLDLQDWPGISS